MELVEFFGRFNEAMKKVECQIKMWQNFDICNIFLKLMFISQFMNLHFSLAQIPLCDNILILVDPYFKIFEGCMASELLVDHV
jgi:hypothetical protein